MGEGSLRSPRRRFRLVHLLWMIALVLSIYEIERNGLYRFFVIGEKYIYSARVNGIDLSVSIPYRIEPPEDDTILVGPGTLDARYRVLKVSFPFGEQAQSCDQIYGLAVYHYSPADGQQSAARRRLLFSFAYDVPNGRCESKQLFIDDLGAPDYIDLQFVDVSESNSELVESPRSTGIRLPLNSKPFDEAQFLPMTVSLPSTHPYMGTQRASINKTFSADPRPEDIKVHLSPQEDLEGLLLSRLEDFIERCKGNRECGALRMAMARIDDPRFVDLFVKARELGVDTEAIINFRSWIGRGDLREPQPLNQLEPLEWLIANPYVPYRPDIRLAMHTKFVVLGKERVFSGVNLYFTRFPYARQNLLEYSDSRITSMFSETFAMIRSGTFVPKRIDSKSRFSLMIGGEKMQRIGAMRRKVSPGVITEDGLRTSAYAVALHEISNASGALTMSMSPLSDECHTFDRQLCFYRILAEKNRSLDTRYLENLSFFFSRKNIAEFDPMFMPGAMRTEQVPEVERYAEKLAVPLERLFFPKLAFGTGGTIHHRLTLVDRRLIIGGSVNLAHDLTLNTVELIRSPEIGRVVDRRITPLDEPYFVAPLRSDLLAYEMRNFGRDANCLFVYEFPAFASRGPSPEHVFSERQVREILGSSDSGFAARSDLFITLPVDQGASAPIPAEVPLSSVPLNGDVKSYSSYLCVGAPGDDTRRIVYLGE